MKSYLACFHHDFYEITSHHQLRWVAPPKTMPEGIAGVDIAPGAADVDAYSIPRGIAR